MDKDNDFADLEAELQQLQPRRPPPELEARISEILSRPELARTTHATTVGGEERALGIWTTWKWANWSVAAALIALLVTLSRWVPPIPAVGPAESETLVSTEPASADPAAVGGLKPVRASRTIVDSRVEGVYELPDGSAVERVRDYFIDTIEWRDPSGRSQLRWEVPRESVRFVGLAAY